MYPNIKDSHAKVSHQHNFPVQLFLADVSFRWLSSSLSFFSLGSSTTTRSFGLVSNSREFATVTLLEQHCWDQGQYSKSVTHLVINWLSRGCSRNLEVTKLPGAQCILIIMEECHTVVYLNVLFENGLKSKMEHNEGKME